MRLAVLSVNRRSSRSFFGFSIACGPIIGQTPWSSDIAFTNHKVVTDASGYQHADYAKALTGFGSPHHLTVCDGWILTSPIPGSSFQDARGCYPVFSCANWAALKQDLEIISDLVSLVVLADPFGNHTAGDLACCFPDLHVPYKEHYVIDLSCPLSEHVSDHHSRNMRQSLDKVEVEKCEYPSRYAGEWIDLYGKLIDRHAIRGISAFSGASLEAQLRVPGLVMFRAIAQNETVGIILWYVQNDVGYYHLAAYNELGYKMKASFALFARAIDYFSAHLRFLSLGAGAGVHNSGDDGLTRFKKGWATGTRMAYLCGRIFDRRSYDELVRAKGSSGTDYFPLYRKGEVL